MSVSKKTASQFLRIGFSFSEDKLGIIANLRKVIRSITL